MVNNKPEQNEDRFSEDHFEDLTHFISQGVRAAKETVKKTGTVLENLSEEGTGAAGEIRKRLEERLGNARNQVSEHLADLRIGGLSEEQQKEMLGKLDKAKDSASEKAEGKNGESEAEKAVQGT
jgi:hypothetical protein